MSNSPTRQRSTAQPTQHRPARYPRSGPGVPAGVTRRGPASLEAQAGAAPVPQWARPWGPPVTVMRVLVTGSRSWTDWRTVMAALSLVWEPDAVLVSGRCPRGADDLAERCWRYWGGQVEAWPADWQRHGRAAGIRRNAAVVASGPDVCVAFVQHASRGASDTVARARAAGVPTFLWRR